MEIKPEHKRLLKWIVIAVGALSIVSVIVYFVFFRDEKPTQQIEQVETRRPEVITPINQDKGTFWISDNDINSLDCTLHNQLKALEIIKNFCERAGTDVFSLLKMAMRMLQMPMDGGDPSADQQNTQS